MPRLLHNLLAIDDIHAMCQLVDTGTHISSVEGVDTCRLLLTHIDSLDGSGVGINHQDLVEEEATLQFLLYLYLEGHLDITRTTDGGCEVLAVPLTAKAGVVADPATLAVPNFAH